MPVAESEMVRIDASERLIFPLDVPNVDTAKEWVHRLDGTVSFFKIGLELYVASGISLIPYLIAHRKKVFLDLKFYDVPATVKAAVKQVAELGVTFLTVHGNSKIVKAAVQGRGRHDLKLLSVTVLTSFDNDDIKELGFECSVQDLALHRARKALEAGCDGVISSPQEAEVISNMINKMIAKKTQSNETESMDGARFLIVTPGIRPHSTDTDDHKRHSTPTDAIKAGADFLVVGRPIREAANPLEVAREIVSEMQAAFDARHNR